MKKLLLILGLLAFVSLGCKQLSGVMGGGGSGTSGGGSATGGSDPKADVIAASKKFVELKSFSAKMEGIGQTEIKQQVDYVAPDRYHVMYQGGNAAGMELIYIGNDSYMKTGGGKWAKMPGGNAAAIPNLRDSFTEAGLKTLTEVKFEGEDTANGKPALVYTYKNQTIVGNNPFSSKIWIGKESGLPVKIVVDYFNGMLKQMTVNYDTDSPVTIEAPAI
jgi:outer membrane lipoprotein-sorting protein